MESLLLNIPLILRSQRAKSGLTDLLSVVPVEDFKAQILDYLKGISTIDLQNENLRLGFAFFQNQLVAWTEQPGHSMFKRLKEIKGLRAVTKCLSGGKEEEPLLHIVDIIMQHISCWQKSRSPGTEGSKVLDVQHIRNEVTKLRAKQTLNIVDLAKILGSTPAISLENHTGKSRMVDHWAIDAYRKLSNFNKTVT